MVVKKVEMRRAEMPNFRIWFFLSKYSYNLYECSCIDAVVLVYSCFLFHSERACDTCKIVHSCKCAWESLPELKKELSSSKGRGEQQAKPLGSKCRKKEKKQHKRKAGKRPLSRSSTVLWLPKLGKHCWVLAGHPVCLVPGRRCCGPAGSCPSGWALVSVHRGSQACERPGHSLSLGAQCLVWILLKTEEKLLATARVRTQEFYLPVLFLWV